MKATLAKLWRTCWFRSCCYVLAIMLLLFLFRYPIMRSIGRYLADADTPEQVDVIAVLGGNSYVRGKEAVNVHRMFPSTPMVCTGGNVPVQLLAFDTVLTESRLTRHFVTKSGVPDSLITCLDQSFSTRDEALELKAYCDSMGYRSLMVITSSYHLRRTGITFRKALEGSSIRLNLHGAPDDSFNPESWWTDEESLITVNNEIMKLIYYFFKY